MTSICSVILAFMLSIGGCANLSVHLSEKPYPGLKIETRELRPIQTGLKQEQQPVLKTRGQATNRGAYLRDKYRILSKEQLQSTIDELTGKNYHRILEETISGNEYSFRYLSEEGLSKTLISGKVRGYMTDRFTSLSSEAAKGAQIMPKWGVPKYGVAIPNIKLFRFKVPRPFGNTGKFGWELFSNSYPKAGSGHWLQFLGEAALEDVYIFPLRKQ